MYHCASSSRCTIYNSDTYAFARYEQIGKPKKRRISASSGVPLVQVLRVGFAPSLVLARTFYYAASRIDQNPSLHIREHGDRYGEGRELQVVHGATAQSLPSVFAI